MVSSCTNLLEMKRKLIYLNETGPREGDPKLQAWEEEDLMIMPGFRSMIPITCSIPQPEIFGTICEKAKKTGFCFYLCPSDQD